MPSLSRIKTRIRAAAILLALLALPAHAGTVTGIIDSTTVQIDLTQPVRIAHILAPATTAAALREVLLNQPVTVTGSRTDATGTTSASLARVDGEDVAAQLVAHGLAYVWPLQGGDDLSLAKLLVIEGQARARSAGIWGDPDFVLTPERAAKRLNGYGIVEGTVTAAASVKGRYYLNFGPNPKTDWKTDFTAQLSKAAINNLLLPPYAINWTELTGKRVRLRGWIEWRNGPMLTVTAPAQLEVVK